MGVNKIERLADLVWHKSNLRVFCGCGHSSIVDAAKMLRWYECHRYWTAWHSLGLHLYCSRCGNRPRGWRGDARSPTAPDRFPRDEREWQRLVRRLRG